MYFPSPRAASDSVPWKTVLASDRFSQMDPAVDFPVHVASLLHPWDVICFAKCPATLPSESFTENWAWDVRVSLPNELPVPPGWRALAPVAGSAGNSSLGTILSIPELASGLA